MQKQSWLSKTLFGFSITSFFNDDGNLAVASYTPAVKTSASNYISAHELATLELEIKERPDITQMIKDGLQIASLALIPKTKYSATMQRIKTIKAQ